MNRTLPILLLTLVSGCNLLSKKDAAQDAGAPADPGLATAVADAAVTAKSATADAGAQPAWPAGTNQELKLTWAVYPPVGSGESAKRNVEIIARIGDVVRRAPLGAYQGLLMPDAQGVCDPARKKADEVGKLSLYLGGETSIVAKRSKPDTIEIISTSGPDVECKDCTKTKALTTLTIPADAKIVEALLDIPAAGKDAPFDCSPPKKIKVAGGEVSVDDAPDKSWIVKLDTKQVFQSKPTNPGPKPAVQWQVKGKAGYDDVIVFSQVPAKPPTTGCTSYGYWFLGVKADGTYKASQTVPYCGSAGVRPSLESTADKMTLTLPERPRSGGTGTVPKETWVFQNGAVKKQ